MSNILVHNYLGQIDPVAVRRVVLQNLPGLVESVRRMLGEDTKAA